MSMSQGPQPGETANGGAQRRIVLITGSGRSGTSTMSGALRELGLRVPPPEVPPDATNPRGFAEPQWVVDFHQQMLDEAVVHISDARPEAWALVQEVAADQERRAELTGWLEEQFAQATDLVVKDPRISWFLDMWSDVTADLGAVTTLVVMLRPPSEVAGSKNTYYERDAVDSVASWVNIMAHTERTTRHMARVFVRYADMLENWRGPVARVAAASGVAALQSLDPSRAARVDEFIEPGLRRIQSGWGDLEVPGQLRGLATETWDRLNVLVEHDLDSGATADLERLSSEFDRYYAECAAVAASSIQIERHRANVQAQRAHERWVATRLEVERAREASDTLRQQSATLRKERDELRTERDQLRRQRRRLRRQRDRLQAELTETRGHLDRITQRLAPVLTVRQQVRRVARLVRPSSR